MCRIVLVGPTYPLRGGISHYTTLLADALRQRHEIHLFGFSRQYPDWLYPGRAQQEPTPTGLPIVTPERTLDGVNPISWWRTARTIRRLSPDCLILQWTVPYWAPLLWLLLRGVPASTTKLIICHNATPHEVGRAAGLRESVQRALLSRADGLICHASSDQQRLQTMLPQQRIERVMHPTYAPLAAPTNEPTHQAGGPHLLFFGFVRPYKGVDLLLRAMPHVLAAFPEATLTIAGEWWEPSDALLAPLTPHVRHAITVHDRYIPHDEMAALFHAADVVVLPYRSATQSGVVQLAFGFGLPVITTDVGGLAEAVRHEESGLLVPPNDPQALADEIIRYVREGWRERLAAGVAESRDRFSWDVLVDTVESLCRAND
ncbi:MAG: glycosyltransferase family 4 protein [Anaerolineales bacterium]|nr:glycosyltransferase family 4 protein [Anaerolineales bacterium]MCB9127975.1 glycosyltransferase family 4 protein [Ardenticatenales bacterium]MCB9171991.1 glycosyltransferase family 4 protein [Ardenticatenales bacterium]